MMNKIIIIFFIIFSFLCGELVKAHPLDITGTEIVVDKETSKIEVSSFIHPFLVNLLLEREGLFNTYVEIIYDHPQVLTTYFEKKFSIKSNGESCEFKFFNLPPKDEFEILGGGVELEAEVECAEIGVIEYRNNMFVEYSPLQTNQMFFYKKGDNQTSIHERILTSKIFTNQFDFNNPSAQKKELDTDGDGLSDVEEEIYKTDKLKIDTDGDAYSDKEEVDNGWNPLSFEPSMGQKKIVDEPIFNNKEEAVDREEVVEEIIIQNEYIKGESRAEDIVSTTTKREIEFKGVSNTVDISTSAARSVPVTVEPSDNSSGAKYFKTGKLEGYLKKINDLFENAGILSAILIFIIIYFLGTLHAFESGHGKSILISYLIEKDRKFSDGIKFSAFLSITHLIDVVILVVLFKVFSLVSESQKYIALIQKGGAYILLIVAMFYLVQNLLPRRSCPTYKSAGVLGILAGLVPCTIGWALMIMIISINKVNWLIPIIFVFGLGIFSTLVVFSYFLVKLKDRVVGKSENLSRYAGLASSIMLITIALFLIFKY